MLQTLRLYNYIFKCSMSCHILVCFIFGTQFSAGFNCLPFNKRSTCLHHMTKFVQDLNSSLHGHGIYFLLEDILLPLKSVVLLACCTVVILDLPFIALLG